MTCMKELNLANAKFRGIYWAVATALILLVGFLAGWKYVWMVGMAAGMLSHPIGQIAQKKNYRAIVRRVREERRDAGE